MGADDLDEWQRQHHADLGGLDARVQAQHGQITELRQGLTELNRATQLSFEQVNRSIVDLGQSLSSQIGSANLAFASSGRANWGNIIAGASVVIMLGGAVIAPISMRIGETVAQVGRLDELAAKKSDIQKSLDEQTVWLTREADRQLFNERNAVKPEVVADLTKEVERVALRIESVDGQLVKRPEIMAALLAIEGRIDSAVHRMDQLEADYRALNPVSNKFEDLSAQLRELRATVAVLARSVPLKPPAD